MFELFEYFIEETSVLYETEAWSPGQPNMDSHWFRSEEMAGAFTTVNNTSATDMFPFLANLSEIDGTSQFDPVELPNMSTESFAFFDFGNLLDDLILVVDAFFFPVVPGDLNLVGAEQFTHDGTFDPINQCIVVGDVANDIFFIQVQTGQTCSLMAQEQFIARMTGNSIPEDELVRIATDMGVYCPTMGTSAPGWNAILDYFGVPNTAHFYADTNMLNAATQRGDDILIGVDARVFYNDPTIPPGSGHAVTVVGHGLDPSSGVLNGYYITDSNFPGQAHFKTVAELERAWDSHMISVPTHMTA
jgi:hypothetical protein